MPLIFMAAVMLGPVRLHAAEQTAGEIVLETKGYIVPAHQVSVSPKVAGQVVELLVVEGQRVRAGDVLARLDPAEYQAALKLAQAELKLAEAEFARSKDGAGKADLVVAQAKVTVAQARVDLARLHLESTVIAAPINGTILTMRADVGTLIDPRGFQIAANVCDLADLRTLEVEAFIRGGDLLKIAKGQRCTMYLEAFPKVTYRGHVARLLPVADRAKGALGVRIRIEVPEGDERLRPELGAIVQFLAKE
jgi:RND family efflux transporter MFP subunit